MCEDQSCIENILNANTNYVFILSFQLHNQHDVVIYRHYHQSNKTYCYFNAILCLIGLCYQYKSTVSWWSLNQCGVYVSALYAVVAFRKQQSGRLATLLDLRSLVHFRCIWEPREREKGSLFRHQPIRLLRLKSAPL